MGAPDLDAARRAAGEMIDAGVGTVLLFGSLARGDACETSDIDLVAIYDDLGDYRDRAKRRCALEAKAEAAAGCPVDVMVTDAPEWQVRTTKVPCSVEAQIADYAVRLAAAVRHSQIDWDKEIGLPDTPAAELQARFTDMSDAIAELTVRLRPSLEEIAAAEDGDEAELRALEDVRFARAMGEIAMIAESAAKATHVVTVSTPPPHDHRISILLREQPEFLRHAFTTAAGPDIALDDLHVWRQGATYSADRPQERFQQEPLRAHAAAALAVAAVAADQCRDQDLPESTLTSYDRRSRRAVAALDADLRLVARCDRPAN